MRKVLIQTERDESSVLRIYRVFGSDLNRRAELEIRGRSIHTGFHKIVWVYKSSNGITREEELKNFVLSATYDVESLFIGKITKLVLSFLKGHLSSYLPIKNHKLKYKNYNLILNSGNAHWVWTTMEKPGTDKVVIQNLNLKGFEQNLKDLSLVLEGVKNE